MWSEPRLVGGSPAAAQIGEEKAAVTAEEAGTSFAALLRVEWFDDRIIVLPMIVIDRGDSDYEIRIRGRLIGFIHRAGRVFVALTGTRLDRAEECGQYLMFDLAAGKLATTVGHVLVDVTSESI